MGKNRLEAFSDGVIAIIITIMVLEMKTPNGSEFAALKPVVPVFLSYVLSFIYVAYGMVLLMAAIAYWILQGTIIRHQGRGSLLASAIGGDWKGKLSPTLYFAAIPLSFLRPWIANGLYVLVALLWLVPDRRIERALTNRRGDR